MTSYKELLKERELLETRIQEARRQELAGAIAQVRALVDEFRPDIARYFLCTQGPQCQRRRQSGPQIP